MSRRRKYISRRKYIAARNTKEYNRYVKRFKQREDWMRKHGLEMYDPIMYSKQDYFSNKAVLKEAGETHIQDKLLSDQQFQYSSVFAKNVKRISQERDLEWDEYSYTEIRTGAVDVSGINEILKEEHPEWTSYERRDYIRQEIFGYAK